MRYELLVNDIVIDQYDDIDNLNDAYDLYWHLDWLPRECQREMWFFQPISNTAIRTRDTGDRVDITIRIVD